MLRDLLLWVTKMAPLPPSCLLLPLDGCFVLCGTITLALLLFLSKRTPRGTFVRDRSFLQAWKGILPLSMESEATMNLLSWIRPDHDQESRGQSHQAVPGKEEGTTVQEQEPQLFRSPWKVSGHSATAIRRLLCDNATCVLCERAAREAENVVHIQRLSPEVLALQKPSLPTTSYVERSSLPAISALQNSSIFSRSRSEPPPGFGHLRHSLGALPLLRKRQRPSRREAHTDRHLHPTVSETVIVPTYIRPLGQPHSQVATKREDHFHIIDEQKDKEDVSSASGVSDLPCSNEAEYGHSSGGSKCSVCSHQKILHRHEDKDEDERSSSHGREMDASSKNQGDDQWGTHLVSEKEQDFPVSSLTSSGTSGTRNMAFVALDTPFVPETVLEKLEQHLVVKRIQSTMGLPVVLLRSLKAFLPFAPGSIIQWPLKREVVVVTRPQVLPFKSVAIRRRLEQHVKRRAHHKHWRLPRKFQEVIRHMKVDLPPPGPREEGPGREKGQRAAEPHQFIPRSASTASDTALNSPLHFKPQLQIHIGKKLCQIAQEAFPKRVENSLKITALEEKKTVLPKLIRLHWRQPQLRAGPSLGLRRKADCVEMNVKCKYIQFLWDLPTLYSQSFSKTAPGTLNLLVAPPRVFPPSEFVHAETPFLRISQRWHLDSHVLRKKVQHQWGQPRLVQQSLWQFLSAAPPAAAAAPSNSVTSKGPQVDIKLAPTSTVPFLPLESNRRLDEHIKKKIIERQWGIPQRVMKSFQTFMPMPPTVAKRTRESEKEKVQKRSLPVMEPCLYKLSQALQSHVAKKALEIHLGAAGPFSTLLQTAALQDRKDALPRGISPKSRTWQLRPKELSFMEQTALDHIELNIRHKDLARKWGLPALYKKSLSYLFTGAEFQVHPPPLSRKGITLDFSSLETLFISQATREDLEWHVRRKKMQHVWGLASLVQKSLHLLMPDAPPLHTARHTEVTILPAQITFLGDDSLHELERNVLKRIVLQRWHLPRRVLEPVKRLGIEMAGVLGPRQEVRKPRRVAGSSPGQSEVFHMLQGKAVKETEFHLDKKRVEIVLGDVPAVARVSQQRAFFAQRQPLPKLIPPGCSYLQPRCRFLPFERPEDVAHIEQTLRHKHLMFLWGRSTQSLEALGGMMPKPSLQPLQPRWADRLMFSEVKILFLQEQDSGAFEGHIRRKRLQHEWGLPDTVQRSLRGFMGGAPLQLSYQNTVIDVQVLHKELSFLPLDSRRSLQLHIQRTKQERQWGLPRRVLEALRGLGAESIAGHHPKQMEDGDQHQLGLQSKAVAMGEKGPASQPPSPGAMSPPETLFVSSEAEKRIQLLFLKKCVEVQTGVFPGVVRQSWQNLTPSREPLPKPVSPGCRAPQPRSDFLPFAWAEDVGRLELAVLHHHLASLWGLSRVYVEAVGALQPKLSSGHVRAREGETEFSEEQTTFLEAQVREALDLHVRRKRLEHEWGFPRLIQKSVQGFMRGAPLQPSRQKTERHAPHILCQTPPFLSPSTCTHLEAHIQRRQLHQRWHLPAKALESLKLLYPRLESSPSDLRSNGDGEVLPYCFSHGTVFEHPTVDLVYVEPGGDRDTADSEGATPQWAQVLSTTDPKDMGHVQVYLTKKNLEVQLEATPNIAGLAWTRSSSRQHLPKLIPPGLRMQQHRPSSLAFFPAGETEQIEMAIRCNHIASLWGLGTRYVEALSGMQFKPFSGHFGLRRTGIEFSEAQTLFLQEQERHDLDIHVAKKKIQHTWGFPILVRKSVKAFMQEFPILPTPQKSVICVHIICQEPSFLPQDISSHLEFHVQKMNFQRQWGLPGRVLKSLWLLRPAGEDAGVQRPTPPMLHLDQTWRNFPRDPSSEIAAAGWPAGAQSTEQDLGKKGDVMRALEPQELSRLQLHQAKKYMEVHSGVLPAVAKASVQLADLSSKRPLPKLIPSGHGLLQPRKASLLTVPTEGRDQFEWTVQRHHFARLWGLGPRYREALAGMMPERASASSRHRPANTGFLEVQTLFLQEKDREALEVHAKIKRIQHIWSCPILVQRSMACFMPRAPLYSSTQKLETDICIMLHELHFLPPNAQTHLEHHIQKRKLLQEWGLPKQLLSSLKIFLPTASVMQAPVSLTEEFLEEPKNQERKRTAEAFPLKRESALQSHLQRKRLETHWEVDPRLVKQSRDKARGLETEHLPILTHNGQKCPTDRTQSLLHRTPHTLNELELNVRHKHLAFLWGLPSQYFESFSRMTSTVPISNPPKQQIFHLQVGETPYLQGQEKEALEHHIKKKRLQHHWGLPAAVQRSLQAFAPSLLVPIHPPKRVGQDVKIQVQRSRALPLHSQGNLEDSLKKMIIHQQWGLPKKIHDSLRAFSPALPVRRQKKGGTNLSYYFAKKSHLKKHLRRKSIEINLQSRIEPNTLLTESLSSERNPRSTTQQPVATSAIDGKGPNPSTSPGEVKDLLEFHVLHKKICHEWGLPLLVQKSLLAFCPPLPKPQADQGTVGESLENVKEDSATVGENIFQDDEMKLSVENQLEEVSESPEDTERVSVSTNTTEMEKPDVTGRISWSSKETDFTGRKLQDSKEESSGYLQDTEKDRFASKTLQPLTKTSADVESPQAIAKSTTSPQSPQAPEEADITCQRPETIKDESPGTSKGTTIVSKSLQAAEGATAVGLQTAELVASETPWSVDAKGSSGTRNGGMAFEIPQAAEERSVVGSTPREDATAESERYAPATGTLQMVGEGILGVAEEEGLTDCSLQVGPENVASGSPHATDEMGVAGPQTTEELSISVGSPQAAEGTATTSKGPQATEGARLAGLQTTAGAATETPQAIEATPTSKLPQDEEYEKVTSPKPEASPSVASEIPLAMEGERAVAESTATGKAKIAVDEKSAFPREHHGEKPQPIKDTSTANGRRPPTAEKMMAVNKHEAEKETNVSDKALPTMEGGVSPHVPLEVKPSGSPSPEAVVEEASVPDKDAWAKDETKMVVGGSQDPVSEGSPETSLMGHSRQAIEEKSIILGKITDGRSPEEIRALDSSEAAAKEGITAEGLSCKEEGDPEKGPFLAEEEGGLPEPHPRWAAAAERLPEEGGMQDASGSCQVTARLSTEAGGPQAAERKGRVGKSLVQGRTAHTATPLGGQAPKQSQELFRTFLPHLESRFHSYSKPTRVHFLAETDIKSHSSLQKKLPLYRTELWLQLEHGGRIGCWVSTEKPPSPLFPRTPPGMEGSERGGSQETEPEKSKTRLSRPKGGSSHETLGEKLVPCVPLQQETPEQDLRTLPEPGEYGSPSLLLPQSSCYEYDASRRDSQASDSSEISSLESHARSMPSSSVEQLLWDKERFSQQLECSIQGMVRPGAPPSGLSKSVRHHVTYSPYECGTTVCEGDVDERWEQQGVAFPMASDAGARPMEDEETQKQIRCAESIVQDYLPGQENLLKPSEATANPLLRTHITQRALGSFILPACVISSYSSQEDAMVGLIRQAGREHRQKLSAQLPILEREGESPLEQGHRAAGGRPRTSAALYRGEPEAWADGHLWEPSPSPPPPSLNVSRTSLEQQDYECSQITEEAGEASREGSDVLSKTFSTGSELPAPPSDWLRSETEEEGTEGGSEDSSSLVIKDVPQTPHHHSTQQSPTASEDQSQFSTECEWERVGDWESESLTTEEESIDLDLEERPPGGSSLKAEEASPRSQAGRASSSSRREKSKGLSLIGSIVERKLFLKQGLRFWQRSQDRWPATWVEENRHGVPSEDEEAREAGEGRAAFSGNAEHTPEGDVAGRWVHTHAAGQSGEETCRRGGTRAPQTEKFLMGRLGFRQSPDTSTSSASSHSQVDWSSSENYTNERTMGPEGELAWDRSGSKASTLISAAGKRRNPKPRSPESPSEGGAGRRIEGCSRRKRRPGERGRESSSCGERPSSGTSSSEGQPATLAQGARIRPWRSCRRKESLMHLGSSSQHFPQGEQEGRAGQPIGQSPTAWTSPRNRGGFSERGVLRLGPPEYQAAGREGSPLGDSLEPPGSHRLSETTARPAGPKRPLPDGEQLRNLKEKILLRRKELWSSPNSEEENPV